MHIKVTNGVPERYSVGQLRQDNPQVSFPKNILDETLAEYNVFSCAETPPPGITYAQNVTESFEQVGGAWAQAWVVTDASAAEIQQRTQEQGQSVRAQRNEALADSDWTQLSDAPVNQADWVAYRQELRDVTDQSGFPWNVTWPNKPN